MLVKNRMGGERIKGTEGEIELSEKEMFVPEVEKTKASLAELPGGFCSEQSTALLKN